MGIYNKGSFAIDEQVEAPEANMSYEGNSGLARILSENMINDRMLFEALIENDFAEVALGESATDEQLGAVLEAATGGFVDKIITLLKTIWAKIKGFFANFVKMIQNVLIRDNKAYVEKTKGAVLAKDLSKMTFKWRKPVRPVGASLPKTAASVTVDIEKEFADATGKSVEDIQKMITAIGEEKWKMDKWKTGDEKITSLESLDQDYFDAFFGDVEEQEGLSSSELQTMMETLITSKKELAAVKDFEAELDKIYSKELAAINKVKTSMDKLIPNSDKKEKVAVTGMDGKDRKYNVSQATVASKALSYVYTLVNATKAIAVKRANLFAGVVKFNIRQSRSVYAKAVMYNPKSVKENALLEEYGEAAGYDVDMLFGHDYE
jgi:hypothetical protein